MSDRIAILKNRLAKSRVFLNNILDEVGDRWEQRVYEDGAQWNVRQIVIHLNDAEAGMLGTAKKIIEGGEGVPADFDLDRYNKRAVEKREETNVEAARSQLAATRESLLAWVDTLNDEQLDKVGRHASLNMFSIEQFLKIMSSHERGHAQDIARVLAISAQAD